MSTCRVDWIPAFTSGFCSSVRQPLLMALLKEYVRPQLDDRLCPWVSKTWRFDTGQVSGNNWINQHEPHFVCVCVCDRACTCTLSVSETMGSSSPSSSWLVVSGSAMNVGFSCRIHFLYTLITLRVAEASQDGSRKAYTATQKQMMHTDTIDKLWGFWYQGLYDML